MSGRIYVYLDEVMAEPDALRRYLGEIYPGYKNDVSLSESYPHPWNATFQSDIYCRAIVTA